MLGQPIPLHQDNILKLFLQLYSLPKYVDQIDNTAYGSPQRQQKIQQLKDKLKFLYSKFGVHYHHKEEQQLTPASYHHQKVVLRHKLAHILNHMYPDQTTFGLVDKIYRKLDCQYEKQCEKLIKHLVQFKKQQDIKKFILDLLEVKFNSYDQDGDGMIQESQINNVIQKYKLPKIIGKNILQSADMSKDGKVSLKQFKSYAERLVLKYYKIFYNLDSDNDNMLNYKQAKQSLNQVFPNVDIERAFNSIFLTMDRDKTGLISFDEWCEFLIIFPDVNMNFMINQWNIIATNMTSAEQSSSFMDKDLIKGMQIRKGKMILSYQDIIRTLIFGGIAGTLSRTITAPLQTIKVLYQTMYKQTKVPSISKGLVQIYNHHGIPALFKGNSISIFMNCLEQALRFTIIQYSKKSYEVRGDKITPWQYIYIGVITGVISSSFLFPFQCLRVRYISTNCLTSVRAYAKQIYHNSGFLGFYNGFAPYLASVLPAGSFNVMSYNLLRKALISQKEAKNPKLWKFMLIGGTAAMITNTVVYPMSLITSRLIMINKDINQYKKRTKILQMIRTTYNQQGLSGFYKGFKASIMRVFIGQSINFGTYQSLKILWTMKNNYQAHSSKH